MKKEISERVTGRRHDSGNVGRMWQLQRRKYRENPKIMI